ncbi:MAG: zf-HC2 domain-containing protein [Vicinamibacterales bacterium]
MTHIHCDYAGDRDDALIGYLYEDIDPAARAGFEAHLTTCAACRDELSALTSVRGRLGQWLPPERQSAVGGGQTLAQEPVVSGRSWWRELPAWAQVAAALLFLGVAGGIANVDARYDASGLSVKTGWSRRSPVEAEVPALGTEPSAPWRSDLAALEARLRSELRVSNTSTSALEAAATRPGRLAASLDAQAMESVRTLIGESERHQQRELALRVAEIVRDVNAQRQADLIKIDRNLGLIQNSTGVEVMRQRELLNYYLRTAQRQ